MNTDRIKKISEDFSEKLVEYRRWVHQHAELSFQETACNQFLRSHLEGLNITFKEGITGNSIVAVYDSGKEGPYIGFRADYDALPITETNGLPYASENQGVMHACGHDAHAAILLCMAEAINANPDLAVGKIAFIFQQGEEKLPGGARAVIADGGLEGLDCIYALHVRTNLAVGQYDCEPGSRSSAAQAYECVITGTGGHTGFPQLAKDPVRALGAAIPALTSIPADCFGPRDTITVSVSYIHTNNEKSPNVFARTVKFGGSLRSPSNASIAAVHEMMEKRLKAACEPYGCTFELSIDPGYAAVENTSEHYQYVVEAGDALGYEMKPMDDIMGAEDFSYMLLDKPGAYFTVGFCDPAAPGSAGDRHTPTLMIDERGMRVGLELMLGTYLTTLEKLQK